MDSNLTVELYVTKKSCQNLVNESCNIWMKTRFKKIHDREKFQECQNFKNDQNS